MYQSIALTVGLRYTRANRRSQFISFISLTSILGLILGVAVLIIVLSVMNGFDRELRQRILGMVPHATVQTSDPITDWQTVADQVVATPGVAGAAPFVHGQGMFTYKGIVHLAGALDVPTFVLLPYACDWRWGTTSNSTDWYNYVQLLRQNKPDDWSKPLIQLKDHISIYIN